MTKEEIIRLAERVASGIATDEEVHLYNQVYDSFQSSENEWQDDIHGSKADLEMMIKKDIWKKAEITKPVIRMKWIRWAAAVLIIASGAAAFFIINGRSTKTPTAVLPNQNDRFKNDVNPGTEGAILTLSEGRVIVLDSAGNGSLAQQGDAEIIKKNRQIVYMQQGDPANVVYNTMTTPNGRQYSLVLADGSKVWLNAASSITFPTGFTGKERKVTITGEVYFEVAHNDQLPFIVQKGGMSIEVLGTHFNVNAYDDEVPINVTLLEGSVKVKQGSAVSLIKPGQQAQLRNEEIKLLDHADIDAVMAWKNGLFDFEGTDMGSLMRQLSRWYDVEVVYDKKVNDLFYAEIPRDTKLSDVLRALELTGKVRFGIDGKKIMVITP